jgi:hypothetical protein
MAQRRNPCANRSSRYLIDFKDGNLDTADAQCSPVRIRTAEFAIANICPAGSSDFTRAVYCDIGRVDLPMMSGTRVRSTEPRSPPMTVLPAITHTLLRRIDFARFIAAIAVGALFLLIDRAQRD